MIESYAYLHLALETEAPPQSQTLCNSINSEKLSTYAYKGFLSLAVILTVVSVADTAQALLTVGDGGSQVQQVQQRLRELGYFHANATGYYGPITHRAVLQFQHDYGLSADGIVGDQTLSALKLSAHPQPTSHSKPHPKPDAEYHPITNDRHLIGLGVGDRGPGVKDLQNRLKELGFFHSHATGYFGSITREAVIQFQKQCSIVATGLVTEDTLAALNARGKGYGDAHPTAALLPARFLRLGDVGATVGLLQQRLQILGYYHGLITQSYDRQTAAAVREFQITNGIEATGIVGPTTLSYIKEQLTTASVPYHPQRQLRSNQDASQYLQRKLRSQGHPNPEIGQEFDANPSQDRVHPQKQEQLLPTTTLDVSTVYEQAQIKPRLRAASSSRSSTPTRSHPLWVTDKYLELGDVGTEVRKVQRKLRQLNFYTGPINGFYDPLTEQAVIRFQRANRITETGVVGPTTQTYLFNAQSPSAPPEEPAATESSSSTQSPE